MDAPTASEILKRIEEFGEFEAGLIGNELGIVSSLEVLDNIHSYIYNNPEKRDKVISKIKAKIPEDWAWDIDSLTKLLDRETKQKT